MRCGMANRRLAMGSRRLHDRIAKAKPWPWHTGDPVRDDVRAPLAALVSEALTSGTQNPSTLGHSTRDGRWCASMKRAADESTPAARDGTKGNTSCARPPGSVMDIPEGVAAAEMCRRSRFHARREGWKPVGAPDADGEWSASGRTSARPAPPPRKLSPVEKRRAIGRTEGPVSPGRAARRHRAAPLACVRRAGETPPRRVGGPVSRAVSVYWEGWGARWCARGGAISAMRDVRMRRSADADGRNGREKILEWRPEITRGSGRGVRTGGETHW